eukprot:CAMPEP_0206245474 /NCGR_PEP_ID=MMETSP0047_2-20121206/18716_1 /ASSEMBLY_ACC=CAM_ASM_000192 /TAXON_ID=195065 /ORGANISM="Chroomonas mesostigmatica_cf, Strain CCMP1168" /LENGTH=100 /DNA_ID=CAMNT_0053670775 /DNA_START=27 /DNA_END=326 /DNA_ORIENTATION=+
MVQTGILRPHKAAQGSAPSTVPYSGDGSQRGTDSTVSYRSGGSSTQSSQLRSETTQSTQSPPGSGGSMRTRSTASTVPYALDYEPAAPPSAPAARRPQHA